MIHRNVLACHRPIQDGITNGFFMYNAAILWKYHVDQGIKKTYFPNSAALSTGFHNAKSSSTRIESDKGNGMMRLVAIDIRVLYRILEAVNLSTDKYSTSQEKLIGEKRHCHRLIFFFSCQITGYFPYRLCTTNTTSTDLQRIWT